MDWQCRTIEDNRSTLFTARVSLSEAIRNLLTISHQDILKGPFMTTFQDKVVRVGFIQLDRKVGIEVVEKLTEVLKSKNPSTHLKAKDASDRVMTGHQRISMH